MYEFRGAFLQTLSVVIFYILSQKNNCHCTNESYWRSFPYTGPVTFNYYSVIPNSSVIRCIGTCFPLHNWDQIYFHNGDCYCLAPVYATADDVSGTITTNYVSRTMIQDVTSCTAEGYTIFSDQRYCLKFFSTKQKFEIAESRCQQDGGHLISIYTQQDATNFRSLYTHDKSVYVGAHRTLEGSDFDWITGGSVETSFWKANEPNNNGGESCVEVQSNGRFNDKRCSTEYAYICQILTK